MAPAVCPTSGSHDTSLVSTDEGISVIARGQRETNRVIEWRRDLLAWGSGKASQSRRYFELATRGGRRGNSEVRTSLLEKEIGGRWGWLEPSQSVGMEGHEGRRTELEKAF